MKMVKNLFEDLAAEQKKEQLTKIRVIAKLKNNDVKGAHRLAKPYLEKIKEGLSYGEVIPPCWLRISQALCAGDISKYGISQGKTTRTTTDKNWIEVAYKIVCQRLEGIKEALVPASIAMALLTQVLQPLNANAQGPSAYGATPDQLTLSEEDITAFGKLKVSASSEIRDDNHNVTKPELVWSLKDKINEPIPENKESKLIGSVLLKDGKKEPKLSWSITETNYNKETKTIELKIQAKNNSKDAAPIKHFSMSDAIYEGASLKLSDTVSQEYNKYRSPSEIPPGSSLTYSASVSKNSLPVIMFRTKDGETHTMIVKLQPIEVLENNKERKSWTTYSAVNDSYQDIKASVLAEEPAKIAEITVITKKGTISYRPDEIFLAHPNNRIEIKVEGGIGGEHKINIVTRSRDSTREYKLLTSKIEKVHEKLIQNYDRLLRKLFLAKENYLSWEGIKTAYDRERSALVELTAEEIPKTGEDLMPIATTLSLEEAVKTETVEEYLEGELSSPKSNTKEPKEELLSRILEYESKMGGKKVVIYAPGTEQHR